MNWVAWTNGANHKSGAGYGFRIGREDRDSHFRRSWKEVAVVLPEPNGSTVTTVNIAKDSFWEGDCRELISAGIGQWLIRSGHAPWPKYHPPRFEVTAVDRAKFVVGWKASR